MASESFLQLRVESIAAFASCRAGEMSGALMLVVRGACSSRSVKKWQLQDQVNVVSSHF